MKTGNQQLIIGIAAAVLATLLLGTYFYTRKEVREETTPVPVQETTAEVDENKESVETSTNDASNDAPVTNINEGNIVFEEVPLEESASTPMPNIDRPVSFADTMPEDARTLYREKISALTASIKETGGTISEWLSLGILFKQVGDYEGARLAWEYVARLRPESNVAFLNLGDLFHYYLKDYPQAEENFKQGIANDPNYVPGYLGLHELYKYSYRENTAATVTALLDGLAATDDNINLLVPLASYYAEAGDTDNARMYYEKALAKARSAGDTARAALIEGELNRL